MDEISAWAGHIHAFFNIFLLSYQISYLNQQKNMKGVYSISIIFFIILDFFGIIYSLSNGFFATQTLLSLIEFASTLLHYAIVIKATNSKQWKYLIGSLVVCFFIWRRTSFELDSCFVRQLPTTVYGIVVSVLGAMIFNLKSSIQQVLWGISVGFTKTTYTELNIHTIGYLLKFIVVVFFGAHPLNPLWYYLLFIYMTGIGIPIVVFVIVYLKKLFFS